MIGKLVLFGAAIGGFMFVVATVLLGVGALVGIFSSMLNVIDKIIPDVEVMGINISSFIGAGLGITIVSKLFTGLNKAAGFALDKMMELPIISELFDKLGLKINENESAWKNFKLIFSGIWDKVKEKLNINDESNGIGAQVGILETKFRNLKTNIKNWMNDLGITGPDGAIKTLQNFNQMLNNLTPSINTIADALSYVGRILDDIVWFLGEIKDLTGGSMNNFDYSGNGGGGRGGGGVDFSNWGWLFNPNRGKTENDFSYETWTKPQHHSVPNIL